MIFEGEAVFTKAQVVSLYDVTERTLERINFSNAKPLTQNCISANTLTDNGANEFNTERHQPLLPLEAHLKEVTSFLETDNIKTQDLGKIAKNYYFSGKG
ncbi:hypothetical protein [Shewanella marisflavi]|uniref:hypothetical protein n=1 Tax=Shewanella marisflavi TaxID=260364 RepID=UPI0015E85002|nr:hypothetical protein [Shewanella marisflavi]